jgi:16S rRNA (uracil1498-N3)-methyltransferase
VTGQTLRLFVAPDSLGAGELTLRGADAERAYQRGARSGGTMIALDNSGWEITVRLDEARPELCHGRTMGRSLAKECRTKIRLFHGLLHPSDFRRLLTQATTMGVVAFVPLITDRSVVPAVAADGAVEGAADWPRLIRDAAEAAGRGRRPLVSSPTLFDPALDQARGSGASLLLQPGASAADAVLTARPFSIDIFCPPPGGFSIEERSRAAGRALVPVDPLRGGEDPIQPALAIVRQIYALLEV